MAYRQTYLKVNLAAISHNIKAIKYRSSKELIGVVKANGYGVGDLAIAEALIKEGAVMLAVSSLDEALHLRKNNIKIDILILGYVDPKDLEIVKQYKLILTVPSLDWVKEISSKDPLNLRVHVKVDTKMNRLGITTLSDWKMALTMLNKLGVKVEGAFTHYASSDEEDNYITKVQYQLFEEYLDASPIKFKWIHAANSDASFHFKEEKRTNAVRAGIALLGYCRYNEDLMPALGLYSRIVMIKHVPANETISYGCTYTTEKDEIIATLPIGYADGLVRKNQDRLVYINEDKVQIVGRICMDQCMIKLNKDAKINDEVEIFGPNIKLENMAKELDTTVYEIITLISNRVARIFYDKKPTNLKHH